MSPSPSVLHRVRDGGEDLHGQSFELPLVARIARRGNSASLPLSAMTQLVPEAIVDVVRRWRDEDNPPQPATAWPRERWVAMFPRHQEFLRKLPQALDRDDVRSLCLAAGSGPLPAEQGFIAVMVWGYGNDVGYGPWRTNRVLSETADAAERLAAAARSARTEGALAAYGRMRPGGDCSLRWLGPAFGTKYLYFCQPPEAPLAALIFDNLVATWLRRSSGLDLNPVSWSPRTYETYLRQMHRWATALACAPDELEYCVFRDIATERQTQWAVKAVGVKVSERQSLEAMRRFLQTYCDRERDTLVSEVLSDTEASRGGHLPASAAWVEWVRCVRAASETP